MSSAVDPVLVLVLLLNFYVVGTSRLHAVINGVALQGAVLGVLALLVHSGSVLSVLVALATILLKGLLMPMMLRRAMREASIRREVEPFIDYVPSLLAVAVATGASFAFARRLPLAPQHVGSLLVPASLATVGTGFLVLATRRKAITQAAGYVVLENGVFVLGVGLLEAMPFLVEVGVLLDLFVAIFVMGIIIYQVNREFASLDTARLSNLKE
ncbi:MAG: hydrogenase [Deltaproteobacteria bacterium]|nr:hydrogenase [Deltaproteobacteria bacterium]